MRILLLGILNMHIPPKTIQQIENEFTRKAFSAHYEYLKDFLYTLNKRQHIVILVMVNSQPTNYSLSPEDASNIETLDNGLSFTSIVDGVETKVFIPWGNLGTIYSPEIERQVAPPLGDPFAVLHLAVASNRPITQDPAIPNESLKTFNVFEERPDVLEKRSKIKLC